MFNKLVTDAAINVIVDEYDGHVDIYDDETQFTIARINHDAVEVVELTVKEAARLQRELQAFVTRHGKRMSTAKAKAARIRAK